MFMDIVDSKPVARKDCRAINGKLSVRPLPRTRRFMLLTDVDWPIAETYMEAEAVQLAAEHNEHQALVAECVQLLEGNRLLGARLEQLASEKAELAGENERLREACRKALTCASLNSDVCALLRAAINRETT